MAEGSLSALARLRRKSPKMMMDTGIIAPAYAEVINAMIIIMISLNVANRNNLMTETDGCFFFFFLLSLVFKVTGCEDGKDADKGACLASSASAEMLFDESELETVMKGTRNKMSACVDHKMCSVFIRGPRMRSFGALHCLSFFFLLRQVISALVIHRNV